VANVWKSAQLPVTKEMQMKTTIKYHLTPVNMAVTKKVENIGKTVEKV
jgi:hypothetical protein